MEHLLTVKKLVFFTLFQCDKRSALFTTEAVRHEREISNATIGKNCILPKEINANRFF